MTQKTLKLGGKFIVVFDGMVFENAAFRPKSSNAPSPYSCEIDAYIEELKRLKAGLAKKHGGDVKVFTHIAQAFFLRPMNPAEAKDYEKIAKVEEQKKNAALEKEKTRILQLLKKRPEVIDEFYAQQKVEDAASRV